MTVYCQKCKAAFDGNGNCPVCGGAKVRPALPDDICFLADTDPVLGGMLKGCSRAKRDSGTEQQFDRRRYGNESRFNV